MVYKYISSKKIIALLYDEGVKTTDWEGRIPNWCLKALKAIANNKTLWRVPVTLTIKDYKLVFPEELDAIESIEFNGRKMYEVRKNRRIGKDKPEYRMDYMIQNGNIEFAITDREVTINGLYYPIDYDESTGIYYPLYPNVDAVEDYLKFYCLRNIILRGYVHPMYSFNILNNETNINVLLKESKRQAKRALNTIGKEERRRLANIVMRADSDHNIDVTRLFL